jgi:hypothetical protein
MGRVVVVAVGAASECFVQRAHRLFWLRCVACCLQQGVALVVSERQTVQICGAGCGVRTASGGDAQFGDNM